MKTDDENCSRNNSEQEVRKVPQAVIVINDVEVQPTAEITINRVWMDFEDGMKVAVNVL